MKGNEGLNSVKGALDQKKFVILDKLTDLVIYIKNNPSKIDQQKITSGKLEIAKIMSTLNKLELTWFETEYQKWFKKEIKGVKNEDRNRYT